MDATLPSHDQALAVFAHEFREPLAAILYAVHAMTTSTGEGSDTREMCEIVERQSRYVARLIDDVLEVCRGRSGKAHLHKDWFDLSRVMTQAVEATKPLLSQRGHHLAVSLPAEGMCVLVDAVRVQQVVTNLLANAAKYTNPGGLIRLAVKTTGNLIVIEVRDNGVGIPKTLLPQIFDLFRQGDELPKGIFSGLGIGLALVKSLVELQGGNVSAHSEGVGAGSAFIVRLPGANLAIHRGRAQPEFTPGLRYANSRDATSPMCDA
jgi:signal transduction histidine kinase